MPAPLSPIRLMLCQSKAWTPELDVTVMRACGFEVMQLPGAPWQKPAHRWRAADHCAWMDVPRVTGDVQTARTLLAHMLPGFWVNSGHCGRRAHATIGPDYHGPDRDRVRREWPPREAVHAFTSEVSGGLPHNECCALLDCLFQAIEAAETIGVAA